jgi:hypothetical protein
MKRDSVCAMVAEGIGTWERVWAVAVAVVVVGAVALPGLRTLLEDDAADGFPLSTYPMFVNDKGRTVRQATVVAAGPNVDDPIGVHDEVDRLSPRQIAQTDQVIQASVTVQNAVRAGPEGARALCEEVAGRVDSPATVVVVLEEFDSIAWAADTSVDPIDRSEQARCRATG